MTPQSPRGGLWSSPSGGVLPSLGTYHLERWEIGDLSRMVLCPRTTGAITSGARRPASSPRRMNSAKVGKKRPITSSGDDDLAVEARVEVDNHADTCVAGRNFRVLYYTDKECQVCQDFTPS